MTKHELIQKALQAQKKAFAFDEIASMCKGEIIRYGAEKRAYRYALKAANYYRMARELNNDYTIEQCQENINRATLRLAQLANESHSDSAGRIEIYRYALERWTDRYVFCVQNEISQMSLSEQIDIVRTHDNALYRTIALDELRYADWENVDNARILYDILSVIYRKADAVLWCFIDKYRCPNCGEFVEHEDKHKESTPGYFDPHWGGEPPDYRWTCSDEDISF